MLFLRQNVNVKTFSGSRALARCAFFCVAFFLGSITSLAQQSNLTLGDAIRSTLTKSPAVLIQQESINLQAGALRQAAGQFDTTLLADGTHAHTYRPLTAYETFLYGQYDGFDLSNAATNTSVISAAATKQFRNGIVLTQTLNATRITDNLTNRGGISEGAVDFSVTIPLLRGRGRAATDVQEMAAGRQVEAARFEVNETISAAVAAVVTSYWRVVAATQLVRFLRESEDRADTLTKNTQSLIDADRLPKSDISQVRANKAIRTANRLAAEQQLLEARQQLAIDMGLDAGQVEQMPDLADGFPPALTADAIPSAQDALAAYTRMALERRPELHALQMRQQAAALSANAAKLLLKPQLDVTLGTGASGLSEGTRIDQFFTAPLHSARGADFTGGINYRFPPRRDAAAGALQQATSIKHQTDLQYTDLARRTAAAVLPALAGFHSEALQLQNTRLSVDAYQASLDAERERLRAGAGSVINVVNLEDHVVSVLQTLVQAELEYAVQLVNLRLATSTIVSATDKGGSIDPAIFSLPPTITDSASSESTAPAKTVQGDHL